MSAGQFVSVDQRLRIPIAALALATTFLIGAVAGATLPSIVGGTGHAVAGSLSPAALTSGGGDMSSAAYAAQHPATVVVPATHTDMSSAAYAAQHPAVGASSSTRGDTTSAANLNHRAR